MLAVEKLDQRGWQEGDGGGKGGGRVVCRLESRGKWILGGRAFPPEEKSWTNRICVFVQVTNRHSTWRNYLYEKAEQNNYTNGSGHFLVFICVSVQKKRLFGFPNKTDTKKNSHEQKKLRNEICVFAYLSIRPTKSQP